MKYFLLSLLAVCITLFVNAQNPLQIFGGKDHDVYLGCLDCNNFNSNSVWNSYGTFGSKFNSNSIWNSYGTYGSNYSDYSPFNSYANYPPVIVDKDGTFYGYFTVNEYKAKRANFGLAMTIYMYYDMIRDDVPKWYDKIFN